MQKCPIYQLSEALIKKASLRHPGIKNELQIGGKLFSCARITAVYLLKFFGGVGGWQIWKILTGPDK